MRKMILLAAMAAMAALMLAATPALAQSDKVTICHTPPPNDFTLEVPEEALGGHLGHGDYLGECKDNDNNDNNNNNNNDRDFRNFCRFFDCNNNNNNNAVPVFEISQDLDQDAESGDVDQSFDVSQTGDNSNQTAGIQGVANTGNAQTQLGVIDAGGFGGFNNGNNDVVFVDDFCDFDGKGFCDNDNNDNNDDLCDVFGSDFCDNDDDLCDVFGGDFCDNDDNDRFVFVDDDNDDGFFTNNGGDFEFEDVGSTIELSPTNTTSSDQQVNQAAAAFGK